MINNNFNPSKWMFKRLRENEIGKGLGLSTGRINPWDLSEYRTGRSNLLKERDIALSDLGNRFSRSDIKGPGAALALERTGSGYGSNLLNLSNQLQNAFTERGLSLGKQARDEVNNNYWKNIETGLNWQQGHDARQAQPNDFMKTVGAVKGATSALSDVASFGLGGAAMMGWLPGMNGISSMANQGLGINDLMDILRAQGLNIPYPMRTGRQ